MLFEEFDTLYSQHHHFVRNIALEAARERDILDAEDIGQEAWCRVVEWPGSVGEIEDERAWLSTVVRNAARRYYQTRGSDHCGMTNVPVGMHPWIVLWEELEETGQEEVHSR